MINTSINPIANIPKNANVSYLTLSTPKLMLHIEGTTLLGLALFLYAMQGYAWSTFWLLLLVPDLSFVPYMLNRQLGTFVYNALHTITLPLALVAFATMTDWTFGIQLALIWLAHIGVDRTVGYGLKYVDSFKNTHLSKV